MANPYAPVGESSADLWLEKSNLVGAVLGGVAYGLCLFRWRGMGLTH